MKNLNLKNTISVALVAVSAGFFVACGGSESANASNTNSINWETASKEELMKGQPEGVVDVIRTPISFWKALIPYNAQGQVHGILRGFQGGYSKPVSWEVGFDNGLMTFRKQYSALPPYTSIEYSVTCKISEKNGKKISELDKVIETDSDYADKDLSLLCGPEDLGIWEIEEAIANHMKGKQ